MHPEAEFLSADYLKPDPLLFDVFLDRASEAVHGSPNMNCELCKYRVRLPGHEDAVGAAAGRPPPPRPRYRTGRRPRSRGSL